jgi:hypothetical protein
MENALLRTHESRPNPKIMILLVFVLEVVAFLAIRMPQQEE